MKGFFKSEIALFVLFLGLIMAYAWYRTSQRYDIELQGTKFQQQRTLSRE
jgi:hypothetical protein